MISHVVWTTQVPFTHLHWGMEVVGQVFVVEGSLSAEFSRCQCAAVRTRAAPVETRWPPRDIKLKLSTEETNANFRGL